MQLKSLAKVNNALNDINNGSKSSNILDSIGKKYSSDVLKSAISKSTLYADSINRILKVRGLTGDLLQSTTSKLSRITELNRIAEAEKAAASASDEFKASSDGLIGTLKGGGSVFKGLSDPLKGLALSLKSFAAANLPTIAISALTAVVAGGIAVYHNYTHALDIAKDKLKEVSNSFDEASSVLNSYNSELNSNISRINELETLSGSKSLSSNQELEIARLKERNNLLRESIELQNEKVKAEAKELSEQNRKTFSKEFDMDKLSDSENIARDYLSSHDVPDATAYLNEKGSDISSLIVGYAINRQKLQELSSKDASPANRAAISMLEENTQYITDSLNTVFFDTISELSDYKENLIKLMKSDGTFDNTADQSLWNSINAAEKYMYEITGKASTWNKHIFESIAGNSDFATDISALLSGEADTSVDSIDKLNKKLEESGLILEDGKSARDMFLEYLKNAGSGTAAVSESLSSVSSLFKESTNKLSSATLADLNAEASTLSSIRSLLDGSGSLNSSFLSQILQQFPEATDAVLKFSQGLMSSEELFNSLADIYAGDSRQYINSVLSKSAADRDFFNSIKTNYPVLFDKLAAVYGNDVLNWKSLEDAKKTIDDALRAELGKEWADYFNIIVDSASGILSMSFDDSDLALYDPEEAERLNTLFDRKKERLKEITEPARELHNTAYQAIASSMDLSWNNVQDNNTVKDDSGYPSDAAGNVTDTWREEFDRQLALLEHHHNMGLISEDKYYAALNVLNEKYFANQEQYLDDYRSYAEKIYTGLKQFYTDSLNEQLSCMDKAAKAVTGCLDEQQSALELQKTAVEAEYNARIEALEDEQAALLEQKTAIEGQKKELEEQLNAINKANEARQRSIDLRKKEYELARAENQNSMRVMVNGQMIWRNDSSAVSDAAEALDEALDEQKRAAVQEQIDSLDDSINAIDDKSAAISSSILSLKEELDSITSGIDAQIQALTQYRDRWAALPQQFEDSQNQIYASMLLGQEWQSSVLNLDEELLTQFGDEYTRVQEQLQYVTDASSDEIALMGNVLQSSGQTGEDSLNSLMEIGSSALLSLADSTTASSSSICGSLDDIRSKADGARNALEQLAALDTVSLHPDSTGFSVQSVNLHDIPDAPAIVSDISDISCYSSAPVVNIESGAITLNEVDDAERVGEAILSIVPNYVTQRLNYR